MELCTCPFVSSGDSSTGTVLFRETKPESFYYILLPTQGQASPDQILTRVQKSNEASTVPWLWPCVCCTAVCGHACMNGWALPCGGDRAIQDVRGG
jgi:hypothetical protein